MKLMLGLATILTAISLQARAADLVVDCLYDTASRMPGVLIPFKIKGPLMDTATFSGATVTTNNGADCRILVDPFVKNLFHLKCAEETQVMIQAVAVNNNQAHQVNYGPLSVTLPAGGLTVVKPPTQDPNVILGKSLFGTYCLTCHNPASVKRDRTAAQITGAIKSEDQMKSLTVLTADQINKIAAYLKSL